MFTLKVRVVQNLPLRSKQALESIKELRRLEHSPSQVLNWMDKAGMNYQKAGQIPAVNAITKKNSIMIFDL